MSSVTARLVRRSLRAMVKPTPLDDRFVSESRRRIDGAPTPTFLGRHVGLRTVAPGELGATEGEWVGVPAARRHLVYLHGGYYIAGRTHLYRNLAARLATGLDAEVLLVRYRLAPEHPYPAAVDDAIAAYRALLDRDVDPATVAILGDSAGGGLTLAVLLRARAEGTPLPAAAVVFSPWTDLTCSSDSVDRNDAADDVLSAGALREAAACYAGDADLADPGISPLFGDLSGLPPLLVTVDASETLHDDARQLVERAEAAGTRCELHEETGLFHIWPALVPFVPEARRTVSEVVTFLDHELA